MKTYKGFDKDLRCRGFQYEVGKQYEENEAVACETGFHACENPMDVFSYYAPADSRYCEVEQDGKISTHTDDSKIASTKIHIKTEIGLKGIIEAGVNFITSGNEAHSVTTGNRAHSATTGSRAHSATTGDWAHSVTTGDWAHSATTGDWAHSVTTGDWAHSATTGNWAHSATTGDWAHSATTGNEAHSVTTGNWAHSATTGNRAHSATTGNEAHSVTTGDWAYSAVKGKNAIAAALGIDSRVRGEIGSHLVCAEWIEDDRDEWQLVGVHSAKVDGKIILPDTWYTVCDGEFVEVSDDA